MCFFSYGFTKVLLEVSLKTTLFALNHLFVNITIHCSRQTVKSVLQRSNDRV